MAKLGEKVIKNFKAKAISSFIGSPARTLLKNPPNQRYVN